MHFDDLHLWQHSHTFGQDRRRPGEQRTIIVIALTASMMVVEITAGVAFGSMALLADGLHMASHAVALSVNAFAYIYARRHAQDSRYSFGTGKVNALGGFTGAVLLAVFALMMSWESIERVANPIEIAFNQAILVAILGLIVNAASVFILGFPHGDRRDGEHKYRHSHHHDHNLRSAYLHVLADAVTSLLAIFALLMARYSGFIWMDPLMGIVGAVLIFRWSWGLLRTSGSVLLDSQGPEDVHKRIKDSIEAAGEDRVADLHLWSIAPNMYSAVVSVVTHAPKLPEIYKQSIPDDLGVVHVTVEVHKCLEEANDMPTRRTETCPHD
jgi:cation diffusion facilitator family transporter